jgi:hypothetical protein
LVPIAFPLPSANSVSGGFSLAAKIFCGPAEYGLEEIRGAGHAVTARKDDIYLEEFMPLN